MDASMAPPADTNARVHLLEVLADLLALMVVQAEPGHDLGWRHQVNWPQRFSQRRLKEFKPPS